MKYATAHFRKKRKSPFDSFPSFSCIDLYIHPTSEVYLEKHCMIYNCYTFVMHCGYFKAFISSTYFCGDFTKSLVCFIICLSFKRKAAKNILRGMLLQYSGLQQQNEIKVKVDITLSLTKISPRKN